MTGSRTTASIETRASRQIVGRVFHGTGLQEALRNLTDEHALRTAWISAIGAFEWVELTEYDQVEQRYLQAHRFERCELLLLQGNLSERDGEPFWHLHGTVSLREDGRDVTYGGHLVDGSVFALEFRIDCYDGLELRRTKDEATGLQLWADIEGAPAEETGVHDVPKAEAGGAGATWAMAAELSARVEEAPEDNRPERGDWIEHTKFGLCKIEGLGGDGVCIIKMSDARRKKIKLDALMVLAPRVDDGRRIFPVRSKRRS